LIDWKPNNLKVFGNNNIERPIRVITKLPNSEQSYKGKIEEGNIFFSINYVSAEKIINDGFSYSENV
jgi:hypothetical protein